MRFERLESWDARHDARIRAGSTLALAESQGPLLGDRASLFARKGSATVLSAAFHLLLLWLLIYKLVGAPGQEDGQRGSGSGLTVIDLSGPVASAPATSKPVAANQTRARQSELDTTAPTDLPTEWSVTRMPSPQEQAQPSQPPAPTPANSTAGGASAAGDQAPYDPYAGAAPMRREMAGALPPARLDEDALAAIVRAISRSFPSADGTAEFIVRVAPDGTIIEADSGRGSASPRAIAALRQALIGRRLFLVENATGPSRLVRLPTVEI